jgi:hypothetical protein
MQEQTKQSNQRTDAWHEARRGRFTGSQISKLLGIKGLGQTGLTYCFEKAVEIVFGYSDEEEFVSFDMKRGIELEPLAFRKFCELKEGEFLDIQECDFFPYGSNAGASPDGIVGKEGVIEIKCPRPEKFFNIVANGIDVVDKDYIAQMQMEMLATNSTHCFFFNYIIFNGVEMWHEIRIERDETMIALIKTRLEEAIAIRDRYVIQLNSNKQF